MEINKLLSVSLLVFCLFFQRESMARQIETFKSNSGITIDIIEKHDIPNVTYSFQFWSAGSFSDPDEKQGLSNFAARVFSRGDKSNDFKSFKDKIEFLGSSMMVTSAYSRLSFFGESLSENLEKTLSLVSQVIKNPRIGKDDFEVVKFENLSAKKARLENDQSLLFAFHRAFFYEKGHPYSKLVTGTNATIEALKIDDIKAFHSEKINKANLRVQFTGNITKSDATKLVDQFMKDLSEGKAGKFKETVPATKKAQRILIIDKPGRSQSQFFISKRTMPLSDPDYPALMVATQIFGSGFNSRLMQEVRVKRGWSYGAYSYIQERYAGDTWGAFTFPALKDTIGAVKLVSEMLSEVRKNGIKKEELDFYVERIINKHPFGYDTPEKMISKHNEELELGLEKGFFFDLPEKIKKLDQKNVNQVIKKWFAGDDDFMLTILAPKEAILEELKKLFPKAEIEIKDYKSL